MITETVCIPPHIFEYYNQTLLSTPHYREESKDLKGLYHYIRDKLKPKARKIPERWAKVEKLEKEFLELYERLKKKEEEIKGKASAKTKQPFYRIHLSDKPSEKISEGLRRRSFSDIAYFGENHEI